MAKKKIIKRAKGDATSDATSTVHQVSDAPCSVDFSRDAKGQPRWAIKVYCEADDLSGAVDKIEAIDKRLRG